MNDLLRKCYEILGLKEGASKDEIVGAFRALYAEGASATERATLNTGRISKR